MHDSKDLDREAHGLICDRGLRIFEPKMQDRLAFERCIVTKDKSGAITGRHAAHSLGAALPPRQSQDPAHFMPRNPHTQERHTGEPEQDVSLNHHHNLLLLSLRHSLSRARAHALSNSLSHARAQSLSRYVHMRVRTLVCVLVYACAYVRVRMCMMVYFYVFVCTFVFITALVGV